MKAKIFGMALAVVLLALMIAPVASVQAVDPGNLYGPGILNGQWFQVKASLKGYQIDGSNVVGPTSGAGTTYLKMNYDAGAGSFTVTTCTQDSNNSGIWHVGESGYPIPLDDIYGAGQIWNFDGDPIWFDNAPNGVYVYLILTMKITTNGSALKKASLSTLSCMSYEYDSKDNLIAIGSCSLKGSTIAPEKVPTDCK